MKKLSEICRLIALCGLLGLVSCKKAPVVDFTITSTELREDEEIRFKNLSTDAASFSWQFGDGSTSAEESPWHKFAEAGEYTVTLEAFAKKGGKGKSESKTMKIEVIKNYKRCTIRTVKVTAMPSLNSSGSGWDEDLSPITPMSYPDLYLAYFNTNSSGTWLDNNRNNHQSDNNPGSLPISINLNQVLVITDLSQSYGFGLIDYDPLPNPLDANGTDDNINPDPIVFTASNYTIDFPTTVEIANSSGLVKLEFQLEWSY